MSEGGFQTTRWTVVARAKGDGDDARAALAELCERYWYPVFLFVRRRCATEEEALDRTQEFFARLIEKRFVEPADPSRGRFRGYLLACVRHDLANQRDHERAAKRGGDARIVSIDARTAAGRFAGEPSTTDDPEREFQRAFARTLLERVLGALRVEHAEAGKEEEFERLRPHLARSASAPSLADVAAALGTTEGATKVRLHRLRRRYAERLRAELADVVDRPGDVEDELRGLFDALRG